MNDYFADDFRTSHERMVAGEGAHIRPPLYVDYGSFISVGARMFAKPTSIGDNVWIGGGAIVLPGLTIGDNSVIGASAVVTKDAPPPRECRRVGNPARVLREI